MWSMSTPAWEFREPSRSTIDKVVNRDRIQNTCSRLRSLDRNPRFIIWFWVVNAFMPSSGQKVVAIRNL